MTAASALLDSPFRFEGPHYAVGFSLWKKRFVKAFLPDAQLSFVRSFQQVPRGAPVVVWGHSVDPALKVATESGELPAATRVLRLEDGFLRSVGLGAGLTRPISWVVDPVGIYYDSTAPSALEQLLETHPFPEPLLNRAQNLIDRIRALNLTKYNVGTLRWTPPATQRPLFLVPGQVECDASIRFGTDAIRTNLALLLAVRKAHPDAFILYKPHPDIVSGLRASGPDEANARLACDAVVADVSMGELLETVQQVHVMTSLTGFEALLRQKTVVCYGTPFYAGWGLTEDRAALARRQRTLSLQQLAAATLLLYPRYLHPDTAQTIEAEDALEILSRHRHAKNAAGNHLLKSYVNRLFQAIVGFHNRANDRKRAVQF